MRKKILAIFLIVLALSCFLFSAVSCKKKHKHEYVARTAIASCTTEGYTEYICSCGDSYRENSEPAHHILTYVDAANATCTEDGHTAYYKCSNCNKLFSDENGKNEITDYDIIFIPATHTITYVAEQPATCTEEGHLAYYECSICGKWFNDEKGQIEINNHDDMFIPAAHTITYVDEQFATCTEEGHLAYYGCIACDKWFSDENGQYEIADHSSISIPAAHTLTYVDEQFATCTEEGHSAYYECSICDKWFNDEFGKDEITDKQSTVASILEHKLTFVPEKPATGLEAGHIAYYECIECVKWFIDEYAQNEITDKENGVTIKAHIITFVPEKTATCIEKGNTAYYECSDCHKYFSDITGVNEITDKESVVTNILPHTLSHVLEEPATCTEEGHFDYYECDICDKWFEDENGVNEITNKNSIFISVLPHTITLVPEQSAGLTIDGHSAYYECEECKKWFSDEKAENEIIDKNSVIIEAVHKLTFVPEQAAICTENGNIAYYTCSKCDKWFNDENAESEITDKNSVVTPATHTITLVPEKPATCAEKGNIAYYECSICAKYFSDENGQNEITDKNSVDIETLPHNYAGGLCTVCGEKQPPTKGLKYTISGSFASVTGIGTATDTDIVIADSYNGRPVTGIGENAFKNCTGLTSVTIPDSITDIGNYAFQNCTGLTSVTIPDSITDIGNYAFNNCTGLISITIGNSVTRINDYAFSGCLRLVEVCNQSTLNIIVGSSNYGYVGYYAKNIYTPMSGQSKLSTLDDYIIYTDGLDKTLVRYVGNETELFLPESIIAINQRAFYNDKNIVSVTIPDSITNISDYSFYGCIGLTSIVIPDSVVSIGEYAFNGCIELNSITIPDSVMSIGDWAFTNSAIYMDRSNWENNVLYIGKHLIKASGQYGNYQIKEGTLTIADNAFYRQYDLTSVIIPDSVLSIGNYAFDGCESGLTSVTIGNGVKIIGSHAFYKLYKITNITIPDSVTSIGDSAFEGCSGLTSVTIGNGVTSIGSYAFRSCSNLSSITLPDSVTIIGDWAFYGCSKLTNITIPDSVTSIGDSAFEGCSGLTSVTIGNGVKIIGSHAFERCSKLTTITIGNSVTCIGEYAFSGGLEITGVYYTGTVDQWVQIDFLGYASNPLFFNANLYINNKLLTEAVITTATKIGRAAFLNYKKLTKITLPYTVTSIGYNAFSGCTGLTGVYYTGTIDQWLQINFGNEFSNPLCCGGKLYINNELLTEISIPTITEIKPYVFYGYSTLTSVTIPDSVTSIGEQAFQNCKGLTSIIISNSITNIGEYAFCGCSGLVSIIIPNSVTSIEEGTFYGCSGLTSITISSSVTTIYDSAFYECSGLTSIYYKGSEIEWNGIGIYNYRNDNLINATKYYYSESEPTTGNYWYYDVDGNIIIWTKQ